MPRIREATVDWPDIYDKTPRNVWEQSPHEFSRRAVSITTPGSVTDLGCGEGYDALYFAEQGYDVTAVDISSTVLDGLNKVAHAREFKVHTVQANIQTFKVSEQQMIIASYGVLHFLGNSYADRIRYFQKQTMQGGVHSFYLFGNKGDFYDIAQHKFWFPDLDGLRDLYKDWHIHRLESKNVALLIKGDNGEPLQNTLVKLLAQK